MRCAVETERFAGSAETRVVASVLDPYKPFIDDRLAQHPRLRASPLCDMIRGRGYSGSEVVVRRYVKKIRPLPREAFFKLETLPGEQGQVDWASFGKIRVGSATRSLSCFVMVLSHSRALFALRARPRAIERCVVTAERASRMSDRELVNLGSCRASPPQRRSPTYPAVAWA